MTGRVVVVTGASSGLGYEVARYLCEGGNDVILACRNEEKAKRAIEKIKRQHPNALATFMNVSKIWSLPLQHHAGIWYTTAVMVVEF